MQTEEQQRAYAMCRVMERMTEIAGDETLTREIRNLRIFCMEARP